MKLIESLLNAHFMRFASSFEKNLKNFLTNFVQIK